MGADTARLFALFAAPPDRDLDWQEDGVAGVSRFLARVYRFVVRHAELARSSSGGPAAASPTTTALLRKLHQTIRKITQDFGGRWHFNTSIAAIMELVNELTAADAAIADGRIAPAAMASILESLVLMTGAVCAASGCRTMGAAWPARWSSASRVAEIRRSAGA